MQITPPALRLSRQLALFTMACLAAASLPAQDPGNPMPDQPDPVYTTAHLDGVVVSSLDGRPVPRVLVTSNDQRMAAITDSSGRFSFDLRRAVPQSGATSHAFSSWPPNPVQAAANTMPIQFLVRRPGYVTGNVTLHVPSVEPDTPEPTLQIKIVPSATLTGHLDPDSGDLPPDASVMLASKNVRNGSAVWNYSRALVNSRGEFRFAGLSPGDYKVFAPPYDPHNKLKAPLPDSVPGFRATFYPNASSFDSAGTIHLGPGETTRTDLVYRSAIFYKVVIPTAGLAEGKSFFASVLNDVPGFPVLSISHDADRLAAQGYLPSGSYSVVLSSREVVTQQNQSPIISVASVHLQIDGKPVSTLPVVFHPAFEVPIEIRLEFTNGPPPQVDPQNFNPFAVVGIEPIGPAGVQPLAFNKQGASFIWNLSEGLFRVTADSAVGGYVASVTSGTTDLLREPLQVLPGVAPRPIEIALRDDPSSINAHLAAAGNLLPQATADQPVYALCIPLDRPQAQAVPLTLSQDFFPVSGLAPGRYLLLASHRQIANSPPPNSGLEYRNEEVLHTLLNQGVVVTLSPGQKADVEVPLMPEDAN
jgi:hypothetical protein